MCLLALNSGPQDKTNVYDRDDNSLFILYTFRVDVLRAVANNYAFINSINSITSIDNRFPERIANTAIHSQIDNIRETTLLTGNGYEDRSQDVEIYSKGNIIV
jgi:hypothetical protein